MLHGEVFPRNLLAEGFRFEGVRVPLIAPQGIFKPAILPEMPLSITTVPEVAGRVPRSVSLRPNPEFLAERFEIFRRAS